MGFLDDVLNGGIDRDFDGDIDSRDRDLYLFEERIRKEEEEREKAARNNQDDWKNYYLDALIDYGIDADDYDDEEEFLEVLKKAQEKDDSEDDEEDDSEDDEEDKINGDDSCEDNGEVIGTISFSIKEPKRTKPTNGVWKYYDESFETWHYDQALIENFPELAEDYEPNVSDNTLPDIITETYEIDQERAVKYLKWLWKTFTPDLFVDEKDSPWERRSYKGRGLLIERLILENENSEDLYKLLKSDADFLYAAFRDCVHKRHEYRLVKYYMVLMISNNDAKFAKMVYACYLEGQKGRYSDKDLGKLWEDIAYNISWLDLDEKDKLEISQQFIPLIEKIGIRGKKPLSTISNFQKEWKDIIDDEEELEEDDDFEEATPVVEDKYAWRNYIAPSKIRLVNPIEYETREEFEKAVKSAYEQETQERLKNRREKYVQSNICSFCKVDMMTEIEPLYYYLTGNLELNVGDEVVVPFGQDNTEMSGVVVSVGKCYTSTFLLGETRIKTVIRKK